MRERLGAGGRSDRKGSPGAAAHVQSPARGQLAADTHTVRPLSRAPPPRPPAARRRSASLDSSVKLWDPATGKLRATLSRHTAMVYALAFSPDGEFLVSGSTDKSVYVWRVRDGGLVRTYAAPSGVYDVAFNASGDKVAVCAANSSVSVLDLRL